MDGDSASTDAHSYLGSQGERAGNITDPRKKAYAWTLGRGEGKRNAAFVVSDDTEDHLSVISISVQGHHFL